MMKYLILFLSAMVLMVGCEAEVNESITIETNRNVDKDLYTINGDIIIGDHCVINGALKSINGRIEIGRESKVEDIKSINGQVKIAENSKVAESVTVINGAVTLKANAVVGQDVNTVNGSIRLVRARVLGNVFTVNGDVFLEDKALVVGSIVVKGKTGEDEKRKVEIFLNDSSVVEGNIDGQKAENTQILVYLDGSSQIKGDVINAELVYKK
ncbi:DUF4097 family beta strand repeat-containing protein [Caldithrix abyssi]|uniref:Polymer-forming protein n=2 Tax=Caldithrix abyssi DSM 13497 TaxID=880073 RepID=A0A1J1CC31_CALAY|nr:hypothetical protein [Caldithrix abyssi]APF19833.1 hypothetical protein Cabys_3085 [Caldithrix abyssi DSM 13497]